LEWLERQRHRFELIQPRTMPLFKNLAMVLVAGGAVYVLMVIWRIDVSAWLASAGIVGIAVGFAAKDTLANLFAGVFILADAPYKVGDYIQLDSGDRGKVTDIGLRSTRVLTRDDLQVTIPNAAIANAKITNESGGRWIKRRLRINVFVAYGTDIDQVRALLEKIAAGSEDVCRDPEPRVRLREFADSALRFELLVWVTDPELRGLVTDQLLGQVYKQFNAAGIEFPYPKRDVYLHQVRGDEEPS
jgi:small-conductance mechanosensitive channel